MARSVGSCTPFAKRSLDGNLLVTAWKLVDRPGGRAPVPVVRRHLADVGVGAGNEAKMTG
jgi:hypothetical protein